MEQYSNNIMMWRVISLSIESRLTGILQLQSLGTFECIYSSKFLETGGGPVTKLLIVARITRANWFVRGSHANVGFVNPKLTKYYNVIIIGSYL